MATLLKSQIWCDQVEKNGTHYVVTIDDQEFTLAKAEFRKLMFTGSATLHAD